MLNRLFCIIKVNLRKPFKNIQNQEIRKYILYKNEAYI